MNKALTNDIAHLRKRIRYSYKFYSRHPLESKLKTRIAHKKAILVLFH